MSPTPRSGKLRHAMADTQYIREYATLTRHLSEVRQRSRNRWLRVGIALPVLLLAVMGAYRILPELAFFVAAVGTGVLFFLSMTSGSTVNAGALTGVEGEVSALRCLEALPEAYRLFNQFVVPDRTAGGYGRRELDFVVVGPDALFVVEVKNLAGAVYVSPEEKEWAVARKGGCGNRPSWNRMANPLDQVRAQASALERWLLESGIACRPQPVVCFTHPGVILQNIDASPIPVTTTGTLVSTIEGFDPPAPFGPRTHDAVVRMLAGHQSGGGKAKPGADTQARLGDNPAP